MREAIGILIGLAPMILAVIYPFICVLRGQHAGGSFFRCWGLIVCSFTMFSLVIPLAISAFSKELGSIVFSYMPDSPIIVGMLFFGWFYAGVTVLTALAVRGVIRYFRLKVKPSHTA